MNYPFTKLEPEYANLLAKMRPTRQSEITMTVGRLLTNVLQNRYKIVSDELQIPQIFIATTFERESGSNFSRSPAQGDPWNQRSTHVPKGRGPFDSWHAAAIDSYKLKDLQKIGKARWTWTRFCYECERFNGFGYRYRGVNSAYLWSGSTNYTGGKFVADGKFDYRVHDKQLGVTPVARDMVISRPDLNLDLPGWPGQKGHPSGWPDQPPEGVGGGDHDTAWIQTSLNTVLQIDPPLVVDDNYGQQTELMVREFQALNGLDVDGLCGPRTFAALESALNRNVVGDRLRHDAPAE